MPTELLVAIYVLALAAEIVGLMLMSYTYLTTVRWRDLPILWLSALVRGAQARGTAVSRPVDELSAAETQRRNLRALQGLAVLGVGFALQAGVTVWTLTHPV